MAALNKLQYPSWAAQSKQGTFKFRMQICKDGKVSKVITKGSTGNPKLDKAMQSEIQRMKIPRPPAKVAKNMKTNCVFLRYNFQWTASGTVR